MNEPTIKYSLRPGNYINDWCMVTDNQGRTIITSKMLNKVPISFRLSQVKFIPINSPKILEQLGFKRRKHTNLEYVKDAEIANIFSVKYFEKEEICEGSEAGWYLMVDGRELPKRLKYVHQLQNTWFELTDEPLKKI